jgi:hypothetical protein
VKQLHNKTIGFGFAQVANQEQNMVNSNPNHDRFSNALRGPVNVEVIAVLKMRDFMGMKRHQTTNWGDEFEMGQNYFLTN